MHLKQAVALLLTLQVSFCKGVEKINGTTDWGLAIAQNDDISSDVLNRSLNFVHGFVMKTIEDRKQNLSRLQRKIDSRGGQSKQNPCKVVKDESDLPPDCRGTNESKVYTIKPRGTNATSFRAFCLKDDAGDPWTVIQRRFDGSVDFKVDWNKYKIGFGSLDGEFWLGLDHIHTLTYSDRYELRVTLTNQDDQIYVSYYDNFLISDEDSSYTLKSVGTHSGNLSNARGRHMNVKWSTFDRDNDWYDWANCAAEFEAGWWYSNCAHCNLNAPFKYRKKNGLKGQGITWVPFDKNNTFKATEMAIRIKKLS